MNVRIIYSTIILFLCLNCTYSAIDTSSTKLIYLHDAFSIKDKKQKKRELKGAVIEFKQNDDFATTLYVNGGSVIINQFGKNNIRKNNKARLNYKTITYRYIGHLVLNHKLFLIGKGMDHQKGLFRILAFQFDESTLGFKSDPVSIFEEKPVNFHHDVKMVNDVHKDNLFALLVGKSGVKQKSEWELLLFDSTFKVIRKKIEFPINDFVVKINNVYVKSIDSIALATYNSLNGRLFWPKKGNPSYSMKLYFFNSSNNQIIGFSLCKRGYHPSEFTFTLDNKQLIAFGFYSKSNFLKLDGVFCQKMDIKSTDLVVDNYAEISKEVGNELLSKGDVRRMENIAKRTGEYSMPELNLMDAIILDDGGVLMVAEDIRSTESVRMVFPIILLPTYHYSYGSIIILKLNQFGSLEWVKKENKLASGHRFYRNQFFSLWNDEDETLNLIYNKNLKFKLNSTSKLKRQSRQADAFVLKVSPNGELVKTPLLTNEREKTLCTYPYNAINYAPNEYYIKLFVDGKQSYFKLLMNK